MFEELAMAARARREVGRIVAQNVWSKSIPGTCAQPCTQSLAFIVPFLSFVNANKADERATGGNLQAINGCPASVVLVICDFGAFGADPSHAIFRHRLFTRTRILGNVVDCKGASGTTSSGWFVATRSESEYRAAGLYGSEGDIRREFA
eukprot:6183001-Pleurochrysis_carterae.AAC.1